MRQLSASPHADMVRDDAERELRQILDGGGHGRMLLGLMAASGGGLSADDLAELTGESPQTVERVLRTVSGRTFRSLQQATGAPVFVLAHEELQTTAISSLNSDELAGLRNRLHDWADRYHQRGWPPRTPKYLLNGYYRMLYATGDITRMVACATDPARHDLMRDVTGSDASALAEITTAQEIILALDVQIHHF